MHTGLLNETRTLLQLGSNSHLRNIRHSLVRRYPLHNAPSLFTNKNDFSETTELKIKQIFYNALVPVMYSGVSGQCSHTISMLKISQNPVIYNLMYILFGMSKYNLGF